MIYNNKKTKKLVCKIAVIISIGISSWPAFSDTTKSALTCSTENKPLLNEEELDFPFRPEDSLRELTDRSIEFSINLDTAVGYKENIFLATPR